MEEPSATELQYEHLAVRRQYRALASVSLLLLIGGASFFHYTERFSWVNAFYFCTMTLTTVGYGDIVPKTNTGKIFDMGYVIVGIGIIATFANLLVKNAVIRRQMRNASKKRGM